MRRVRRGSISSELLMCGGGVRNILLLPLVTRCLETIDVCIWRIYLFNNPHRYSKFSGSRKLSSRIVLTVVLVSKRCGKQYS